ncbi:prenyltransferase/squalene oxidase repeat-containing protein [Nonomuraea lactucae]|uniref:prenyltransferase/squalene oxidase repeat-containing protein n=1 Tax=Nonomuraea lactucae TaxID=2249762 RepID=UPI000DE1CE84|nr:prenyltransferase/squalene oxidase repeat-containing protein [Nonomuraea lactucae]
MAEPWGQVSASVYETGRLVTLAPWLTGHTQRVNHLTSTQRPDGGWGAPGGYALVPTLSATEALLREASADAALSRAAASGLDALFRWLESDLPLPDMPAVELIVPSLVALINERLDSLRETPVSGLDLWAGQGRLPLPKGMSEAKLAMIRHHVRTGEGVPEKLLHALEVVGDAACGAQAVGVETAGNVGASPAATAAWLGDRPPPARGDTAREYLERAVEWHAGPVPCALPVTEFERGWVLSWLLRAGVPVAVPPRLVAELGAAIHRHGTSGGAGLPADADSTSVALHALAMLGAGREPDSLWHFETDTHFCTWPGEQGDSVTTNAHVLDAFGHHVAEGTGGTDRRYPKAVEKISSWLVDQQLPDGNWWDRWHASPFYATACCALALDRYANHPAAVEGAVRWVVDSQRRDGSWGRWDGTVEETAYAMQTLLLTHANVAGRERAAARGYAYLTRADPQPAPALWHDKDLYRPEAIVRAAVLGVVRLMRRDPTIAPSSE